MSETSSSCLVAWEGRADQGPAWAATRDTYDRTDAAPIARLHHVAIGTERPLGSRRNDALAASEQPFVCFVPTDARVAEDDLSEALRYLEQDPRVAAVALGRGIAGSERVTFFGFSWRSDRGRVGSEILAAVGAAVVLRRADLERIGGYDESLCDDAAELLVGWRLWLAGARVHDLRTSAPVDGTDGGTRTGPDVSSRPSIGHPRIEPRALVDAIKVAWRCFDDERSHAALAGGLLVASLVMDAPDAATVLHALSGSIAESGADRAAVRATRARQDAEILPLFGDPLDVPWLDAGVLGSLTEHLSLRELFSRRRRVLVVTGDVVGPGMAGPAIRAWHMAECLSDEHDVVLATTSAFGERASAGTGAGGGTGAGAGFRLEAPDRARFEQLIAWCDIVVVQGFVLLHVEALRHPDKVMVVDVYDILHLEALELSRRASDGSRSEHVQASLHALNDQALRGDFFICASEKQRNYWVGHLSAVGRVNAATYGQDPLLRSLVDVVPFGLPPKAPTRSGPGPRTTIPGVGPDDDVLLWAGGMYDWLDPVTLVRAVEKLRHRRPRVRLVFMGARHPNPEVPPMAMAQRARRLAQSLGIEGTHVFFNEGWVDYDSRQNWLLDATVGVSAHFDHAETAFSFRTRLLDYLWAGLPIVATAGDAFADLIEREGIGRVVAPEDVDGLEQALYELLSDPDAAASCRKNVERLRPSFEWPTTLGPLLRFCREPRRAADRVARPTERAAHGGFARLAQRTRTAAALYASGGPRAVLHVAAQRFRSTGATRSTGGASGTGMRAGAGPASRSARGGPVPP